MNDKVQKNKDGSVRRAWVEALREQANKIERGES